MFHRALLAVAAAVVLVGCLPIELEVSSDGRVLIPRAEGFFTLDAAKGTATRVFHAQGRQPVFGRFVGTQGFLAVTTAKEQEGAGATFHVDHVSLSPGGAPPAVRQLTQATNLTYLTVSPDHKRVAYTRVSEEKTPGVDENLPELHVVDLTSSTDKRPGHAVGVGAFHRWLPDSKSILVFRIENKDEQKQVHGGRLALLDVASGQLTQLAGVLSTPAMFLDLSPDGRKALFVAAAAGAPDARLEAPAGEGGPSELFELDLATKSVRSVRKQVKYAMWSRSGKHVLAATTGGESALVLEVADAGMASFHPVASDAVPQTEGGPAGQTAIYPGWVGDDWIAYLANRSVYGAAGRNLEMVLVRADGKAHKRVQAAIEQAATEDSP